MPRGKCRLHGPDRPCTCAMGNLYRFVEPVVLYLLKRNGASHGYELAAALGGHALTDSQIERAALYRTLQQLEANLYVTSAWDTSMPGPARHVYQLTAPGEKHLAEWRIVLSNFGRSLERFVDDVRSADTGAISSACRAVASDRDPVPRHGSAGRQDQGP